MRNSGSSWVLRTFKAGLVVALAGCGGDDGTSPIPVSAEVSLGATEFALLSGDAVSGAVRFPAAGSQGAEYLVVAQFATGVNDVVADFTLRGIGASAATVSLSRSGLLPREPRRPGAALRFHDYLRRREKEAVRSFAAQRAPGQAAPGAAALASTPQPPPTLGEQRTFKVCANLTCSSLANVPATAVYVGTHAAIFQDDSAPSGGFTTSDFDQLGQQFDNDLYPIDVAAFGSESDVDGNGVVIILLTKKLNELSPKPECEESFIVGFFYGLDIYPPTRAQFNNGEVFYGLVPEPNPPSTRCARSTALVRALLPSTFIHEFQHMISFNQRILLRNASDTDELWLSEALAETASELGGLHYDSLGNATEATRFLLGNLYNLYLYLESPSDSALVTEQQPGSLESRGAGWSLMRYLADRFGSQVLRQMTQTTLSGAANVSAATGTPFSTLLGHWALTHWVNDLSGFTAPTPLTFAFWNFRATYASLNQQLPSDFTRPFPLVPASVTGGQFTVSGRVESGSGAYLRVTQAQGGDGFDLSFRTSSGGALPASGAPQLAIIRIR